MAQAGLVEMSKLAVDGQVDTVRAACYTKRRPQVTKERPEQTKPPRTLDATDLNLGERRGVAGRSAKANTALGKRAGRRS